MRKVVATPRALFTGIGLMLLALLVFSATALATKERPLTGVSFGPAGTGAGTFAEVQGVTVDQSTGDVFVYDDGAGGRIYKFDAAGEPVDFSGLGTNVITGVGGAGASEEEVAVDSSSGPDAGDVYAANNSVVKIYSAAGALLGTLSGGEMCGVAVDASGAVYVGIYGGEGVRKYVPTANPVTNANEVSSLGGLRGICNVAADSEGNLYAAQYTGGVTRYPALQFGSPIPSGTLIDGSGRTLAVDQSTNALYVNEGSAIAEYDASGNLIGTSASGTISGSFGVGVDSAKNELYVPSGGRVMVFGPAVLIPTVSGGGASEITSSSATISGSVNPEGTATTYQFQYGTTTSYGSVSPASPQSVGSDSSTHSVSAQLTGLAPDTEYHYRLSATGANGTSYGPGGTFKTGGPPEVIYEAVRGETQTTVLVGAYIEPNKFDTHYQVEYGASESYGSITAPVDMGTSAREVTQELSGLQPSTIYHFRFVATNSEGTVHGSDQTVSTAPAAQIESESISGATSTEASIKARADLFGAKSTYYFEYGTTSAYGDATPEQGFSTEAQTTLVGLSPETTYHFRVVIKNQYGTVEGEDKTFATFPTPRLGLPDNRGYEKVSPNNNSDGNVYAAWPSSFSTAGGWTERPYEAAPDGDALAYVGMPSEEGGSGFEGGGAGNEYLARRRADGGWEAENITPPTEVIDTESVYQGFSPDLSHGFLTTNTKIPLVPGALADEYHVPYVRDFGTGSYQALLSAVPPHRGKEEFGAYETAKLGNVNEYERVPAFAGASADLSHVLFMANDALTANAVDGGEEGNNLYDFHNGALTLVNVLPDGSPEPSAVYGGPTREPDNPTLNGPDFSHVISKDGNRIFWTGREANPNIYMREGDSRTVQVDASVGGGGQYWTATPDGSKVLFTKSGDLYEYDVESGHTTDLAPGGEVQGIVGTSEDLSYVYVVANAVLAPGGKQGECPYGEECGLYVLHAGEPARFIAMLSKGDNFNELGRARRVGDWQGGLADKEAQVTPDGRQVLFGSVQSLTGYDNKAFIEGREVKDEELFVYEFGGAKLRCVSCDPSGVPPTNYFSGFLPDSHQNTYTRRWMSDDGSRVFFDSLDPLVPQDTNGLTDVYEWERDGSGSCTSSEGCTYLLTGGTGGEGSFMVDSSSSGNDVFFTTRAQLVPEDQNENIDVYDAHVGAVAPPAQPQCTGTGCQGLPSAPPIFATPSSVTYNGVGNFPPESKVAVKVKKAKAKKTQAKKKHKRSKRSKKAKRSAAGRRDKGHGSSTHGSAASYGRSK